MAEMLVISNAYCTRYISKQLEGVSDPPDVSRMTTRTVKGIKRGTIVGIDNTQMQQSNFFYHDPNLSLGTAGLCPHWSVVVGGGRPQPSLSLPLPPLKLL